MIRQIEQAHEDFSVFFHSHCSFDTDNMDVVDQTAGWLLFDDIEMPSSNGERGKLSL